MVHTLLHTYISQSRSVKFFKFALENRPKKRTQSKIIFIDLYRSPFKRIFNEHKKELQRLKGGLSGL